MKINRLLSLFLLLGAMLVALPVLAEQEPVQDYVQPINLPEIGPGELYFRSSLIPEAGPVELPSPPDRPEPGIRPIGGLPGGGGISPMDSAAPGVEPAAGGQIFSGGVMPGGAAGSGTFRDPIRDTERRLKRLIRDLDS